MDTKLHREKSVAILSNRKYDEKSNKKDYSQKFHYVDQSEKIHKLINTEKWGKLKFTLKFCKFTRATYPGYCSTSCDRNYCSLQYACENNPPVGIVKLLIKSNSKAAFDIDCKGRQALHIACKHGCEPDVIKELLRVNPDAAKRPDNKGRSPFLLACKSYVKKSWRRTSWKTANKNLKDVLIALNKVDPRAHSLEDFNHINPLEYALNGELEMRVVRLIQSMAEDRQIKVEKMHKIIDKNESDPLNYELLCMKKNYVLPKSNQEGFKALIQISLP